MQNEHVKELLELMEANNMPGAKDLLTVIGQVGAVEKHLAAMVTELTAMRRELAEAQRQNHPIKNALQKAVITLQDNMLGLRERLDALKQEIIGGCKSALEAFREKGLSALRNLADFFKLRPGLEALQKDIDKSIRLDNKMIAAIETVSAEYHEAGRHIANMGRAVAGKEAIQEAKPVGKVAKAFAAPILADRACLRAMDKCVGKAIGAVGRLEKTEHKPPIRETIEKLNKDIEQAQRDAPARVRVRPVPHAER